MQDYDFDYEEDDDGQEADADIENMYYNAKGERGVTAIFVSVSTLRTCRR